MSQEKIKLFNGFNLLQTGVNNFKYKYTIQNFSLRLEKTGEKFVSPTFVIGSKDRSEWCLSIYPNGQGEKSKEYVSVFLTLLKPEKAKVKFRFSILNDKEEEKNISIEDNIIDLDKGSGWGFPKFVKKDFLLDRSNGLLIDDKFTIICEAEITDLKFENSIPYDVYYTNQTDVNNFKYIYTIENFSLCSEKTGEKIISPTFVIGSKDRSEWCLSIYPNGRGEKSKEYVSVFLTLLKPEKAKTKYRFSILNDKEEEKNVKFDTESKDFVKNEGWGYPEFVKRDFLLNKSNGLLINDKLTIICEAEIIDLKTENCDNPETSINISVPQSKLLLNYGNMFDSSLFTDYIIKVGNTEIKVHKAVLAARSPVFYDILNSTSEESQKNIIEIKDFNAEVVKKTLKYIYKDEVSDIKDMENEIFEIANKYELDRLKAIAEQSMCNSLSIENVCERFALSDKYPTERLKEHCEELILKNLEFLIETSEWKKFVFVCPLLLESLFLKSLNISSMRSNSEKKEKE
uniref:BTB domain-containing protein n=1 Tax=Strongyloides papillosus TaxID=174720 RepID=A0A0N5B6T1_STREA